MNFACEECNNVYSSKDNLIRHVKCKHQNLRYPCVKCGFSFTRKSKLLIHLKNGMIQCAKNKVNIGILSSSSSVAVGAPSTSSLAVGAPSSSVAVGAASSSSSSIAVGAPPSSSVAVGTPSSSIALGAPSSSSSVAVGEPSSSSAVVGTPSPVSSVKFCSKCNQEVDSNNWSYHLRTNAHKRNSCEPYQNGPFKSIKSVFNERIETFLWKNENEGELNADTLFNNIEPYIYEMIVNMLAKHISIKFNIEVFCEYMKIIRNEDESDVEIAIKSHQTKMTSIVNTSTIKNRYDDMVSEIKAKMSEFQERDSGWTLIRILHIELNINQFKPIRGSSYLELPDFIKKKEACINVHNNNDNFCFKWAIISALKPTSIHSNRCSSYNVRNIYDDLITIDSQFILNFTGLSFPLPIIEVNKFETLNPHISITIFGYDDERKKIVGPHHIPKEEKRIHINLLLVEEEDRFHYVWIKNLSR